MKKFRSSETKRNSSETKRNFFFACFLIMVLLVRFLGGNMFYSKIKLFSNLTLPKIQLKVVPEIILVNIEFRFLEAWDVSPNGTELSHKSIFCSMV